MFADVDLAGLWDDSEHSFESCTEPAPTPGQVAAVEAELGFRLQAAYVELAGLRNGGGLERTEVATDTPTSWGEGCVAVSGIHAIAARRPTPCAESWGARTCRPSGATRGGGSASPTAPRAVATR